MKNKELIEKLKELPEDADVFVFSTVWVSSYSLIHTVAFDEVDNTITLEEEYP